MPAENKKAAFVPLISSNIAGPLGVLHLPRLWNKVLLAAIGGRVSVTAIVTDWSAARHK